MSIVVEDDQRHLIVNGSCCVWLRSISQGWVLSGLCYRLGTAYLMRVKARSLYVQCMFSLCSYNAVPVVGGDILVDAATFSRLGSLGLVSQELGLILKLFSVVLKESSKCLPSISSLQNSPLGVGRSGVRHSNRVTCYTTGQVDNTNKRTGLQM